MAVAEQYQHHGLGRQLLDAFESWSMDHGFNWIVIHARENAHRFYIKLGYEIEGDLFTEVGIPHYFMQKRIQQPGAEKAS